MKILQLTAHFSPNLGGVETHLDDLVAELQKRKFDIFVLTYIPLMTKASYKVFENRGRLMILRVPWIKGFFYKLVRHPFLEFIYLFPGLFLYTPFVLIFFRPKVIHSHGLVAGAIAIFWGKIFKKRVIITTHSIYHFPKHGLYNKFVVWLFKNACHILVLSKQSKEEIRALGISSEKISVFTYWVDQNKFKPLDKTEQKKKFNLGSVFTVLFVGRLIEEKGILVLLKAIDQIKQDIRLVIAGDGPLRDEVIQYARKNKKISYLGRVDQSELPYLYNAANVLVVPSIHEEGFGRIILESLSCGTPVIASKRGGIVEAMDESVGRLISIDVPSLAQEIIHLQKRNIFLKNRNQITLYARKQFSINNIHAIINSYGE